MDYQDTLTYLYNSVPMFQQVGGSAYKEGLENTLTLDAHFEHPHRSFRSIHVAGTNGKGSCSHTLAAILQEAGYRVGLYTSPHLVDFRERIRINGQPIPEEYVIRFVEQERGFFEPLHPSFFELTTAMAFRYFADEKVDVAVIEVGLGGRLDCTNIIRPDVCIITNITSENSITFDSISVEKTYHLLDNPDNPNCNLEIKFVYPRKYSDKEVLKNLQRQFVSSYFGENYEQLSPEEAVRKYTDDYLAAYKDMEEDYKAEVAKSDETPVGSWFSYYEMSSDDIAFNQDDIISYTVSFENYTGGAHGAHSYNNHVVNLKTGKPITEEEIFVDNYQDNLARILVDQIAKQNNVSDAKELENIGFFSVDEIFPNGNFLVDETGITYSFNEYEIAAYVVGVTNVHLPYKEIRYLLRDDSPISQLIEN